MSNSYALYRFNHLVNRLGVPIQIKRTTAAFDPITGLESGASTTTYSMNAAVSVDEGDFDAGEDVESEVFSVVIGGDTPVIPELSDRVVFGGDTFRIVSVEPGYIGADISSYAIKVKS